MSEKGTKKAKRKGAPLVVYFSEEQAERLNVIAKGRHVAKATVVRLALDRLLEELDRGQMHLPLGIDSK